MTETTRAPVPPLPYRPFFGFGTLFGWGLLRVTRWRKVVAIGVAAVVAGFWIGMAIRDADVPAKALSALLGGPILGFGLPLVALLLAAEGFAREVGGRTLVYHLVRPVRLTTLFLARFFAGFLPAALVALLFFASVVLASGVGPFPLHAWLALAGTTFLGTLTLSAVFFTLGALFKHGLVAGLIYIFAVETFLSSVPGSMQQLSVMFHVRSLHYASMVGVLPDLREATAESGLLGRLLRAPDVPPGQAVVTLLAASAVILAVGAWRVSRRDWAL